MQKTYFVNFRWADAFERLPLFNRSVSENSQQADISARPTAIQHCPAKRQRISGILSMIVMKFEFDKQPCISLQTCLMRCFVLFSGVYCVWPIIGRPIVIKIEVSRDFSVHGRLSASRNFHGPTPASPIPQPFGILCYVCIVFYGAS